MAESFSKQLADGTKAMDDQYNLVEGLKEKGEDTEEARMAGLSIVEKQRDLIKDFEAKESVEVSTKDALNEMEGEVGESVSDEVLTYHKNEVNYYEDYFKSVGHKSIVVEIPKEYLGNYKDWLEKRVEVKKDIVSEVEKAGELSDAESIYDHLLGIAENTIEPFLEEIQDEEGEEASGFVAHLKNDLYSGLYAAVGKKFPNELGVSVLKELEKNIKVGSGGGGEEVLEEWEGVGITPGDYEFEEGEADVFSSKEIDNKKIGYQEESMKEESEEVEKKEKKDGEKKNGEKVEENLVLEEVKGDPLLKYLDENYHAPEPDKFVKGDRYVENLLGNVDEFMPERAAQLHDALGSLNQKANPLQRFLINQLMIAVIVPVEENLEFLDVDIPVVGNPYEGIIDRLILKIDSLAKNIDNFSEGVDFATEIQVIALTAQMVIDEYNIDGILDVDLNITHNDEYMMIADVLAYLRANGDDLAYFDEVLVRDPKGNAAYRELLEKEDYSQLSRLTFLVLKGIEENSDNANMVIPLQFAAQFLVRLEDDADLMKSKEFFKGLLGTFMKNEKVMEMFTGGDETMTNLFDELKKSIGGDVFDLVFPAGVYSPEELAELEKAPLGSRMLPMMELFENSLMNDPKEYGKQNALINMAFDNARFFLMQEGSRDKVKNIIQVLIDNLDDLGVDVDDPLSKALLDNKLAGPMLDFVFKEKAEEVPEGESKKLDSMKTLLEGLMEENPDAVLALRAAYSMVDSFSTDAEWKENLTKFKPLMDVIFSVRQIN